MERSMNGLAPDTGNGRTITVFGNSMMPLYGHGDRLIVSNEVPIAVGDRIVVESDRLGLIGGVLVHRDRNGIAVTLGGKSRREVLVKPDDVVYIGRVLWASQ
jgi:phage repressor protein C with HTH and peptisase S24 domain